MRRRSVIVGCGMSRRRVIRGRRLVRRSVLFSGVKIRMIRLRPVVLDLLNLLIILILVKTRVPLFTLH